MAEHTANANTSGTKPGKPSNRPGVEKTAAQYAAENRARNMPLPGGLLRARTER